MFPLSANQVCNQEFFKIWEVSRKKTSSRNTLATINKENASNGNNFGSFYLSTPKTAF